jgi:hypothetical protein
VALLVFSYHYENMGLHTQNSIAWDKMAEHSVWEIWRQNYQLSLFLLTYRNPFLLSRKISYNPRRHLLSVPAPTLKLLSMSRNPYS